MGRIRPVPRKGPCAAAVIASALSAVSPLHASEGVLEEVFVTAQKRTENVQDIPLTINVVDRSILENFSIRDTLDLASAVPGLTIQHTPQNLAQVTVRGLGTGSAGESLDQSVGLFIDGVWAGRIREYQASLFDVERVEVIKGSQTALLGKNTSLGAVSVVTRRPDDTFEAYLQGDYEFEFDSTYVTGAINLPTAFGSYRLAFNAVDEGGYVSNGATGDEVPEREQTTVRLIGTWRLGASGELLLMGQWDDLEIRGDTFQPDEDQLGFMRSMDPTADIGIDRDKRAFTSYTPDGDAYDEQDSVRALVRYDHDFDGYLLTTLTGWSDYDNERFTDTDFLSVDYLTSGFDSDFHQFSQEIRLTSPTGGGFEYIAGLFYLDNHMDYANVTDSSFPQAFAIPVGPLYLPVDSASRVSYEQDTQLLSLFGQGTLYLAERWRLTVGLRYTEEEKDALWGRERLRSGGVLADILSDFLAPVVEPTPLDRSEDNLDGSVNLQYDLSDQTMGFLSWARGSKSGGFAVNVTRPEDAEYGSEEAETVEAGFKMGLARGAALLNASLFYTEIDNFQVTTFVGDGFLTQTVPAESKGLELEAQWAATGALLLGASATYADAQESDSGQRLPYAPRWSGALTGRYDYSWRSAPLLWRVEGILSYRDEQYQQYGETAPDGELTLLDLRLALVSADERWSIALLGRNLLDEESSFGFDLPFFGGSVVPAGTTTIGSLNRPRTLALQARYQF